MINIAKLIVFSSYIKNQTHSENLVQYISTREGVEFNNNSELKGEVSEKQKELINEVVNKFPMIKEVEEYDIFLKNTSKTNASKFLTEAFNLIQDQQIKKEIYLKYIAERPRVEKLETHGLFNLGGEADLKKEIEDIKDHKGVVWTHIISLKREDAKKLGYDNLKGWQLLLKTKIPKIAEAMNIKLDNLVWNAAFHNEGNHPHVHLVMYSKNTKEGYLKEEGIKKIKSTLMNEIFKEELLKIKENKTLKRDEIKTEFEKELDGAYQSIVTKKFKIEDKLINKFIELAKVIPDKGKIVYGYQTKEVKGKVDEIVKIIMKNKNMKLLYEQYENYNKELAVYYSHNEIKGKDITENKEFRKLQNMVLTSAGILPKDIKPQSKTLEDKLKSLDKEIKTIKEQHMNKIEDFKFVDSRKIKRQNFIEESQEILQRKDESIKNITDKFIGVMDKHFENDEQFKKLVDNIFLKPNTDSLDASNINTDILLENLFKDEELKQNYGNYISACKDYNFLINKPKEFSYKTQDFKTLERELATNVLLYKKSAEKKALKTKAESMKNIEEKLLGTIDKYSNDEVFKAKLNDINGSYDRAMEAAEEILVSHELIHDYSMYLKASEKLSRLYGTEYTKEDYKTEFNAIAGELVETANFNKKIGAEDKLKENILNGAEKLKKQYTLSKNIDIVHKDYPDKEQNNINYIIKGAIMDAANDLYFSAVENEIQKNKIVMRNRKINRMKKYKNKNGLNY